MLKNLILPIVLIGGFATAKAVPEKKSLADQIRFQVDKYQLKNGLTVLLHEDHSAPLISYHQWFRVGSRNEKVGRTGLAHFFEHLMFKGTKKYSGKDFERLVRGNGGLNNAFTSRDYTGYYEDMPSGTLPILVDLESDRMRNLLFNDSEIKSEREVVKEERRYRVENSVYGSLHEAIYKTVYKVHPYRWPVVGYMKDLNAASIDNLKEFYRVHYAPNNSVLVIVGDFKKEEAKELIEKHYGPIQAQELPKYTAKKEPTQRGVRSQIIRKSVQNPTVAVVFKGPKSGVDDAFRLDLLSNILGNGSSSRLYKRLVYKKQTALRVGASSYTPMEPGLFQVTASVKPGVRPDGVLSSIYSEIYKVRSRLVSEKELEKAKNQIMKGYVDNLKTISGKAQALALNEIYFGDYREIFRDLDRYNKVTREEILEAAKKYLQANMRSVVQVLPKSSPKGVQ